MHANRWHQMNEQNQDHHLKMYKKSDAVVVEKFGDNANATQALRLLVGSQNFAKAKRALEMARAGKSVPANFMEGLFPLLDLLENVMSGSIANTRVLQQLDKRAKAQLKIKEHYLKEIQNVIAPHGPF